MRINRWIPILALGVFSLPLAVAQSAPADADQTAFQDKQPKSKDGVTTDDTALKPGESGSTKTKQGKSRKAPKSPPNPPIADPQQNPSSPVKQPKTPAGAPQPK
jgi:hypothetical protein